VLPEEREGESRNPGEKSQERPGIHVRGAPEFGSEGRGRDKHMGREGGQVQEGTVREQCGCPAATRPEGHRRPGARLVTTPPAMLARPCPL
jgi:hypothetical protein